MALHHIVHFIRPSIFCTAAALSAHMCAHGGDVGGTGREGKALISASAPQTSLRWGGVRLWGAEARLGWVGGWVGGWVLVRAYQQIPDPDRSIFGRRPQSVTVLEERQHASAMPNELSEHAPALQRGKVRKDWARCGLLNIAQPPQFPPERRGAICRTNP